MKKCCQTVINFRFWSSISLTSYVHSIIPSVNKTLDFIVPGHSNAYVPFLLLKAPATSK